MVDTSVSERMKLNSSPGYALAAFIVAGLNLVLLFGYLGRRQFLLNPIWIYLVGYALAFGWYAYAAGRILPRLRKISPRVVLAVILTGALFFRLAVLAAPPSLSTDMFRYAWDGRLTLHGINPYRWTPNSQTLRSLHDPLWQQMEYKPYQTIYMPISQAVFALGYTLFGENLIGYKVFYALFDIGVIVLLLRLLAWLRRPLTHVIWYAWCPLPITEVSLAGHQDIVGVFFLLLTLDLLLHRPRLIGAGGALAASILTKGFALLLLPLFVRSYGRRFAFATILALIYLGMPLWVYLPEFLLGMRQYLDNVHVNAGLFYWINLGLSHVTQRYHYPITEKISDLVIGITALWAAWRPIASDETMIRRAFIVLSVTLLLVPTLFPWYLIWPLALMPLLGRRPSYALVLLSGLSVLLYTYYIDMRTYWWISLAEYGPFYLALGVDYLLWRRRHPPVPERTRRLPRRLLAALRPVSPLPRAQDPLVPPEKTTI